ncbi:UNVERIFIED_CONTAM: hypothetical protein Sradi_3571500 [Sesamum radiatum]|uniref:Uncharacterized protein n=1 Tax=Sesamum radiatum TaxID=300843 RepID=A0AAW2QG95_SESRA
MKELNDSGNQTRHVPTNIDPRAAEIVQWLDKDQIGRGAILSTLSNTVFDVYCSDSYTTKYSVFKFMQYQMVEDRSTTEKTHEIINLEHASADTEMKLPEKFLVMSIVDKIFKFWEYFSMTLKH